MKQTKDLRQYCIKSWSNTRSSQIGINVRTKEWFQQSKPFWADESLGIVYKKMNDWNRVALPKARTYFNRRDQVAGMWESWHFKIVNNCKQVLLRLSENGQEEEWGPTKVLNTEA